MGESKGLSRGLCLFDSETEQRALQFCIFIAQMYAVTPRLYFLGLEHRLAFACYI